MMPSLVWREPRRKAHGRSFDSEVGCGVGNRESHSPIPSAGHSWKRLVAISTCGLILGRQSADFQILKGAQKRVQYCTSKRILTCIPGSDNLRYTLK